MTVAELIERLKRMPQELQVRVGYEGIAQPVQTVGTHHLSYDRGRTEIDVVIISDESA